MSGITEGPGATELAVARARAMMERYLGLGVSGYFDAAVEERRAAEQAAELIATNYAAAVFVRETIRAARRIRTDHSLPKDLGWPREALRVARKIFGELRGRVIGGRHPLTGSFLEAGCLEAVDVRPDIVVASAPEDGARRCEVAFELGTECADARYRFAAEDLERMMREEMKRSYPRNLEQVIALEADRVMRRVDAELSGTPRMEITRTLEELQRGIATKYDDAPSLKLLADKISDSLAGFRPDELRMIRDFLEDCVATKVVGAVRGRNR